MVSTSPRWVAFTVITNAVTNSATLSMTQEYTEGFKVWTMAFDGVTTNGAFAYIWQGASNEFLRAEFPTNAAGATMPLSVSMLDSDFEGMTNAVSETFDVYRDADLPNYYSTCSITGPRENIGRPAFSSRSAFVVRLPAAFAAIAGAGDPVCEISVDEGDPVTVPLTQEQDGAYISCLVVPVSELDAEADLGLAGLTVPSISITPPENVGSTRGWRTINITISKVLEGTKEKIAVAPVEINRAALFSATVRDEGQSQQGADLGVVQAGSIAINRLKYDVTPLFTPDKEQINEMLKRHSVWVHTGHGSHTEGIAIVEKVGTKYKQALFKASDISSSDLE